jgi:hypothetical protein
MVHPDSSGEISSEAEAQEEATVMPWLWGGIGLLLIAGFVGWTLVAAPHGHHIRQPAGAAPTLHPAGQHD